MLSERKFDILALPGLIFREKEPSSLPSSSYARNEIAIIRSQFRLDPVVSTSNKKYTAADGATLKLSYMLCFFDRFLPVLFFFLARFGFVLFC